MFRRTALSSVPFILGYAYITYERRPLSPLNEPELYHTNHQRLHPSDRSKPLSETFRSFRQDSISSNIMRSFTLSAITGLCRFYLSSCNVNIQGLEQFHDILQHSWSAADLSANDTDSAALKLNNNSTSALTSTSTSTSSTLFVRRPVLTVSNHMSTLDDPIILSRIAPLSCLSDVKKHRWGGCSEEICFTSAVAASFFGSGKILPVWRGGGLSQEMFQELALHLVPGSWVHVFPEGTVCQKHFNYSSSKNRRRSYTRWGVGKMIAKAKVRPIVVPFYHDGLEEALPLFDDIGKSVRTFPKVGVDINVIFGEPIVVDDLLDAFEDRWGKEALAEPWEIPEDDHTLQLYSAIAERIQERMKKMDQRG